MAAWDSTAIPKDCFQPMIRMARLVGLAAGLDLQNQGRSAICAWAGISLATRKGKHPCSIVSGILGGELLRRAGCTSVDGQRGSLNGGPEGAKVEEPALPGYR